MTSPDKEPEEHSTYRTLRNRRISIDNYERTGNRQTRHLLGTGRSVDRTPRRNTLTRRNTDVTDDRINLPRPQNNRSFETLTTEITNSDDDDELINQSEAERESNIPIRTTIETDTLIQSQLDNPIIVDESLIDTNNQNLSVSERQNTAQNIIPTELTDQNRSQSDSTITNLNGSLANITDQIQDQPEQQQTDRIEQSAEITERTLNQTGENTPNQNNRFTKTTDQLQNRSDQNTNNITNSPTDNENRNPAEPTVQSNTSTPHDTHSENPQTPQNNRLSLNTADRSVARFTRRIDRINLENSQTEHSLNSTTSPVRLNIPPQSR